MCIHREFSSDYRGDCFGFAAKKSFCPNNFWKRSRSNPKSMSDSADLRFEAISSSISPSAPRRTPWQARFKAGRATVPFFAHLKRTMYYTLCRVAERAGVACKEAADFAD